MKRLFAIAFATVFVVASLDSAQLTHPTSKTDISFSTPVVVGGTPLGPGRYRFECRTIEGRHVMVVIEKGREVARVPCEPRILDGKVSESGYSSILREDARLLTEIRIKGERISHRLVPAS